MSNLSCYFLQNFYRVKLPGISGPKPGKALVAVANLVQVGDPEFGGKDRVVVGNLVQVLDGGVRVVAGAEPDADPEGDGCLPDEFEAPPLHS